jgi:hypothetical protein
MIGTHADHDKSPAAAGLFYVGNDLLIVGAAFQPRSLVDKPVLNRGWKAAPTKTAMVQTPTFSS